MPNKVSCTNAPSPTVVQCGTPTTQSTQSYVLGLQELLLAEVVQGPVLVGTQGEIPSPPRTSTGGCNGEVEEVVEGLGGLPLALLELGPWGCVSRYLKMTHVHTHTHTHTHTHACTHTHTLTQEDTMESQEYCMYILYVPCGTSKFTSPYAIDVS